KWELPRQHLKEDYPQRIDVRTGVQASAHLQLFRAGVARRSPRRCDERARRIGHNFGDPEIEHFNQLTAGRPFVEHNIRGFEVAMNDMLGVSGFQRGADLSKDSGYALQRKRARCGKFFVKSAAV